MEKNPEKFILDIVPLTKIPLTRNQSFSYLHDKNLSPGTLVSIPLFRRKVEGIVLGSKKDFPRTGGFELKNIDKVLEEEFLGERQIELGKFISDYYISPLGIVMKNFVPKRVKARVPSPALRASSPASGRGGIILTKEQQAAVDEVIKNYSKFKIQNSKFLLYGPSGSGKTEVYIHSILELSKKDKKRQFLILVPEKTLTPQAMERYGAYFKPEEIVLLSSNLSAGKYYSHWQKIKSGEAKIIIGTRMAVFAPFKKLGLIVIDEEQDMSFKQWDMNPRYDARTVAEKLSEINKCPIVRGSATPSVESYWRALKKDLNLLKLPYFQNSKFKIQNSIIADMKRERWDKNYSCISKILKSEIAYALKYGQQVILLVNRQGMSSFSVCESCKTVLKCPKCDRALLYDEKGNFRCAHCPYKTSIIPECPKCRGIVFKNVGLGTQKVEKEIKNLFLGARVARLDSQLIRESGYQEKIYRDFSDHKIDILVGTQMITKGWDLPRVVLVGIIDADNLLSVPDFKTQEKAYQYIVQVSGRVGRLGAKFPGTVVIQTFQPENKIIKMAAENDRETFFQNEIKERKALELPPFGRIIKLVFQDYSRKKTDAEAESVYNMLKNISAVKATEPEDSLLSKIRGRFRKQMVIKCKSGKIPNLLEKELKKLGTGWIIDVDPVSLV